MVNMPETHFKVTVESDHINKLTAAKPIPALAELIWNACDADATRVDVEIDKSEFGMNSITIRDNGHGIPHQDIEHLFGKLGGSWKARGARSKKKRRILHGKEGKGRFKALALGRVADWIIIYQGQGDILYRYTVTVIREDLVDVRVSEPQPADPALHPGVEVRITELDREYRSLEPDQAVNSLAQIFALYLTDYSDLSIFVQHELVDPSKCIASRQNFALADILDGAIAYAAEVELIEWNSITERWIFLCSENGFPFQRIAPTFHAPGAKFSAYLKSSFIDELQRRGLLELSDMSEPLQVAYDEAADRIKAHFRDRDATAARSEIEQWKLENVYPYPNKEPVTAIERAERQVFDIVALNVNKHLPEFSEANHRTKAFQLRMLRQAVERGPDELQLILKEVLDLPPRKQQELAKLLEEADLGNIISASKLVADRLKFVHGLETVLFDPDGKRLLKERSQLHRMLADNTWVFGEHFNLTVDDQSLTEVLRKHRKLIGNDIVIDAPVKRIDGKTGIIDLMLSRSVPQSRADEREHLVIELKRPSVKVGAEEITQVEKYAYTIAQDERFRHLRTRWTFWVVSNDLDPFAVMRTRQKDKPRGQVSQTEDGSIEVWVKTWSEIIAECNARMRFVQEHLQANVDKDTSLSYLKATYDKYLTGIEIEPDAA
jgi:hypothetical protein